MRCFELRLTTRSRYTLHQPARQPFTILWSPMAEDYRLGVARHRGVIEKKKNGPLHRAKHLNRPGYGGTPLSRICTREEVASQGWELCEPSSAKILATAGSAMNAIVPWALLMDMEGTIEAPTTDRWREREALAPTSTTALVQSMPRMLEPSQ